MSRARITLRLLLVLGFAAPTAFAAESFVSGYRNRPIDIVLPDFDVKGTPGLPLQEFLLTGYVAAQKVIHLTRHPSSDRPRLEIKTWREFASLGAWLTLAARPRVNAVEAINAETLPDFFAAIYPDDVSGVASPELLGYLALRWFRESPQYVSTDAALLNQAETWVASHLLLTPTFWRQTPGAKTHTLCAGGLN